MTADSGSIELDGKPIIHNSPALAKSLGIAAVYQHPSLFPELTVAENLFLGLGKPSLWKQVNWSALKSKAAELLASVGVAIDPNALACDSGLRPQARPIKAALVRASGE